MTTAVEITPASLSLFLWYAKDAANWSGAPWLNGNRDFTKADRGNLTQLKRAGLLVTGHEPEGGEYIRWTAAGVGLAAEHGIDLSGFRWAMAG